MYRLMWHFLSMLTIVPFIIFLISIVLLITKNKIDKKIWRILCFTPLIISIIHFIVYYLPNDFIIKRYLYMYIYSVLILLLQFTYNKKKLFKISSIIFIILGFISYFRVFYRTIMDENFHNLYYYNYTDSFDKTISILKKEYVLNEHKKIDYDFLYNKYYPQIKKAEETKDEQLYYKTMYEFANNFKDGHFHFGIYFTNMDETIKRYEFVDEYDNKDYGFASVLLSDGNVVAIYVDENSDAYNQGLRDGMIITKKDNKNIKDVFDEIVLSEGYPVLEDEQLYKSFHLFSSGNDEISVSFIDEEGIEKTINVKTTDTDGTKPYDLYNRVNYYNQLETLYTKMLDDNTGYIYIKDETYDNFKGAIGYVFDDSSYLTKVVDEKLSELKQKGMTNLIIDLRPNSGGYYTESSAIASLFTDETYLGIKLEKNNSKLYDKLYVKGNGKYKDLKVMVLVSTETVSAGDCLVDMLSKMPNVQVMGFTSSNNSAQSIGGMIFLSGGTSVIEYPIYNTYDKDGNIYIDTDETGKANIKLDYKIELTQDNIKEIFYCDEDYDYLLNYAINMMD